MEKFGYHKRDILASRVEKARDSQEEAKEQFKTALESFSEVVEFRGGELEDRYNELAQEFKVSEQKAKNVTDKIDAVESVGSALFREWKEELEQYTSDSLRRSSERSLHETEARYERLLEAMHQAENKIPPVLFAFRDQVLFLKHNLNSRAIASIEHEVLKIESNVALLIGEMERSILEANSFIDSLEEGV
jgi:hypothetical protein